MEIRLTQIDKSDAGKIRDMFNVDHKGILSSHIEITRATIDKWITDSCNSHSFLFALRGSKDVYKSFLVGLCGINQIDWCARHGNLVFFIPNDLLKEVPKIDQDDIQAAMLLLLDFGFMELNLNKVSIELSDDKVLENIIEKRGFVAEGVRRSSKFYSGKFVDSMVFSLLLNEYK